jgi:hypothetical protein
MLARAQNCAHRAHLFCEARLRYEALNHAVWCHPNGHLVATNSRSESDKLIFNPQRRGIFALKQMRLN